MLNRAAHAAFRAMRNNPRFTLLMAFNVGTISYCAYPQLEPFLPVPKLAQPNQDSFTRGKPLTDYLGPNPMQATFKQGKTGDCWVLSGFDAVQHHTLGSWLLESIRVEENKHDPDTPADWYKVYFPSGKVVKIEASELGVVQGKHTPAKGPLGLQLFELAFAKLVSAERNQKKKYAPEPFPHAGHGHELALVSGGQASEALNRVFGNSERSAFRRCYDSPDELRQRLCDIARDDSQEYVLCASTSQKEKGEDNFIQLPPHEDGEERPIKKFYRAHSFSLRKLEEDGTSTVADPHDTAKKVDVLTLEEFGNVFQCISGLRFQRPEEFVKHREHPPE